MASVRPSYRYKGLLYSILDPFPDDTYGEPFTSHILKDYELIEPFSVSTEFPVTVDGEFRVYRYVREITSDGVTVFREFDGIQHAKVSISLKSAISQFSSKTGKNISVESLKKKETRLVFRTVDEEVFSVVTAGSKQSFLYLFWSEVASRFDLGPFWKETTVSNIKTARYSKKFERDGIEFKHNEAAEFRLLLFPGRNSHLGGDGTSAFRVSLYVTVNGFLELLGESWKAKFGSSTTIPLPLSSDGTETLRIEHRHREKIRRRVFKIAEIINKAVEKPPITSNIKDRIFEDIPRTQLLEETAIILRRAGVKWGEPLFRKIIYAVNRRAVEGKSRRISTLLVFTLPWIYPSKQRTLLNTAARWIFNPEWFSDYAAKVRKSEEWEKISDYLNFLVG